MGEVEDNPGGTATRGDVRLNGSNAAESCHESPKSPRSRSQKEWAGGGAGRWFLRHRMRVSASRYFAFLATGYTSRLLSSDIEPWEKSPRNEPCEKSLREEPWARRWAPARRACEIYGTEQGLPTPWTAATPPRSASSWMSENATGGAGGEARRGSQSRNRQRRLLAWLDLHRAVEHKEDVSQLDVICTWLKSTDQLFNGRQKSATTSCRTTTLSKRAPKEVLLAVLEAHELLAGPTCDALTIEWTKFCRQCFLESARANCLKRRSIRGGRGGGVVSNKANITARHSDPSPWDFASRMTLQEMKRQHH